LLLENEQKICANQFLGWIRTRYGKHVFVPDEGNTMALPVSGALKLGLT
jgi:hypothetical protein